MPAIGDQALRRFIPYVQMHEFEGLLFSDADAFAKGLNQTGLELSFRQIRDQFATPEDINDSPITAPSKRIKAAFSQYDKVLHGSLAALEIGLPSIRQQCPLFNGWLTTLEVLATTSYAVEI